MNLDLEAPASGILGLVGGGVLGLILSVLFEDYLKNNLGKSRLRMRKVRWRLKAALWGSPENQTAEHFCLGPLQTTLMIIEGDGEQVIDEQAVQVLVNPVRVELPPDLQTWRTEIVSQQDEQRRAGLEFNWNGEWYAVERLSISRNPIDESPEATFTFKHSDYYNFLATQQLDRRFEDGSTPRSRYLHGKSPHQFPDFMACSFGINVVVVTADEHIIISRRSGRVGSMPNLWSVSANEAVSRSLDSDGRTPPNLYNVARRGLREELGIDQSEFRLELLGFAVDTHRAHWAAMFVAFLHHLHAAEWRERHTRGLPDPWEHMAHEFVRFDVQTLVPYILRPDRRDEWTPTAPALYYFALVRRFGRRHVEKRTNQIVRKMTRHQKSPIQRKH